MVGIFYPRGRDGSKARTGRNQGCTEFTRPWRGPGIKPWERGGGGAPGGRRGGRGGATMGDARPYAGGTIFGVE
ncbi:hypothetical protein Sgleb_46220 [Streptomyces glebosus]|uniref:Uncharacterized protein n=1 Tax=Streptomyces glebosus TaxID=249580 RepID=A0A640T4L3_9ACTN|nr:hypothetical protein Sgleb_46220 [Streptomyces glebosus]GHG76060.1 hypothetical protein GCM10010513_51160 [Streptomyces glebosus]